MMMSETTSIILVVDDVPANLDILGEILKPHFQIYCATSGKKALAMAQKDPQPDLILLDVMMPEMDGFEVCRTLKASARTRHIPVIFVTAMNETANEETGFAEGCVDYLTKPVRPPIVLARVQTHLQMNRQQQILEEKVRERTIELQQARDVAIFGLSALAEKRDNETGDHINRTRHYVKTLAMALQQIPPYRDLVDDAVVELMFKSAPLHDIGKVGIPDAILLKPGKLTSDEFTIMKTHTTIGRDAILQGEKALGIDGSTSFLSLAREVAFSHHERWDGSGYPQGLKGNAIPLVGRLMAVADVYDAMISKRVYKPPFSHTETAKYIAGQGGGHFDPGVVDVFRKFHRRFLEIAMKLTTCAEELSMLEKAWNDVPLDL
ncbi:MAG: response regulator [Candidatus Riflebacteria bacterium]|nr:response regulator [Candidatus Riflebacteria bacterium]